MFASWTAEVQTVAFAAGAVKNTALRDSLKSPSPNTRGEPSRGETEVTMPRTEVVIFADDDGTAP